MQRKIGEIFEYNGEWYQCLKGISCKECDFSSNSITCDIHGAITCTRKGRSDDTSVVFKKLEKVGEPYTHYCPSGRIIYFQRYKLFYKLYSHNTEYIMCDFNEDGIVSIEIKQNKEDMENKRLFSRKVQLRQEDIDYVIDIIRHVILPRTSTYDSIIKEIKQLFISESQDKENNLKPFNLEAAKAGKPVCTRDGRKARIICFDRVNAKPILALIASTDGKGEDVFDYFVNGKRIASALESDLDLMMPSEKKEGWVNISNCPDNGYSNYDSGVIVFKTKEEAINFTNNKDYIDTVKVTWKE